MYCISVLHVGYSIYVQALRDVSTGNDIMDWDLCELVSIWLAGLPGYLARHLAMSFSYGSHFGVTSFPRRGNLFTSLKHVCPSASYY